MLTTARDMQDTLLRYMGANSNAEAVLDIRYAIANALGEVWNAHDWPYYQGQKRIQIDAPYSTGTITFDLATRQVTLAGGTWPTWAVYGTFRVGIKNAKVANRISDTVLELETGTSFTADISSASTYILYRNEYPLDAEVRKLAYVTIDSQSKIPLQYMPAIEFTPPQTTVSGTPRYFTIQKDRKVMSGLSICFWPIPTIAKTVQFSYIRKPKVITHWSETSGVITATADSKSIAGTGTAFESSMVGAVLRIGRNQVAVTGPYGTSPFSEQCSIESVASATALVVQPAVVTARTNVKYEISSLIDIDDEIMSSFFQQQCYFELSKYRQVQGKTQEDILKGLALAMRSAKSKACVDRGIEYAGSFVRNSNIVWVAVGS